MEGWRILFFLFGFDVRHILAKSVLLWHFFYRIDGPYQKVKLVKR